MLNAEHAFERGEGRSEREARKLRLFGLLHPRAEGGELDRAISKSLVGQANRKEEIEKVLAVHGYDLGALDARGHEIVKEIMRLTERNPDELSEDETERLATLIGLAYVRDETGDEGLDRQSYRIGLRSELSEEARKLLRASLEDDEEEQAAILSGTDTPVDEQDLDLFLNAQESDLDSLLRRKTNAIEGVADEGAKRRYKLVAELLGI